MVVENVTETVGTDLIKFALFGKGKMGSAIQAQAKQKGFLQVDLRDAEVIFEFTHADVVLKNIEKHLFLTGVFNFELKKNI